MLIRYDEHEIDKVFRKRLRDAEDTPPLHLWEGVRLATRRRRFPFVWFFALLLLAGAGASALLMFNSESDNSVTQKAVIASSQQFFIGGTESNSSSEISFADSSNMDNEEEKNQTIELNSSVVRKTNSGKSELQKRTQVGNSIPERKNQLGANSISEESISLIMFRRYAGKLGKKFKGGGLAHPDFGVQKEEYYRGKAFTFSLSPYVSLGKVERKFSNDSNQAQQKDFLARTTTKLSKQVGIAFGMHHRSNIYAQAGFEYSDFKEEHRWNFESQTYLFVFDSVGTAYDSTIEQVITVYDSVFVPVPAIKRATVYNRFKTWSIPLTLGWSPELFPGFRLGLQGGVVFNLNKYFGGLVATGTSDSSNDLSSLAPDSAALHKLEDFYHHWLIDIHVAINPEFELRENFSIYLIAQRRWAMEDATIDSDIPHRFRQTYFGMGVRLRL
ncbi:MAG: hypothetical protein SH856_15000 [Flavobacteriales bacterium]|nr:hypothetical protein [Flavobacteriales bacterium]